MLCLVWQELGLGRQAEADWGKLGTSWKLWILHAPFPATPPALTLRTPGRRGTQLHSPACAGRGGGCSVVLFILHLVFLVWSPGAQAGLGA